MRGYLYILECCDGSFYTGSTNNIELRFAEHQAGLGSEYTKKRLPVKLVFLEEFQRVDDAYRRERQVHGWSRKKKIALIQGEYNNLPELSRNRMDSRRNSSPVPEPVEGPGAQDHLPALRQAQGPEV